MAVDDLDTLRAEVPELFDDKEPPAGWEDEWFFVPVSEPLEHLPAELFPPESPKWDWTDQVSDVAGIDARAPEGSRRPPFPGIAAEGIILPPIEGAFPGGPTQSWDAYYPPPDALAFYLPFHYFHPTWWGVYLTYEGVERLAGFLTSVANVTLENARRASQVFLYGHEAFHHAVESFSTRLEVVERAPLYKGPLERLFQRTRSEPHGEEALATAWGALKLREVAKAKWKLKKAELSEIERGISLYIEGLPPGYSDALDILITGEIEEYRCAFAELNHREAFPGRSGGASVWRSFPHAFTGFARVNSRVNYAIHRSSPLASRQRLAGRLLTYRDLERKLRALGCECVAAGKGSHMRWRAKSGATFVVPKHPGDLATGTLSAILRQAGLGMSVSALSRL